MINSVYIIISGAFYSLLSVVCLATRKHNQQVNNYISHSITPYFFVERYKVHNSQSDKPYPPDLKSSSFTLCFQLSYSSKAERVIFQYSGFFITYNIRFSPCFCLILRSIFLLNTLFQLIVKTVGNIKMHDSCFGFFCLFYLRTIRIVIHRIITLSR